MRKLLCTLVGCLLSAAYALPAADVSKKVVPENVPEENAIQKIYGGPFNDLYADSQERSRKFVEKLIAAFHSLEGAPPGVGDHFEKSFLPVMKPLESGTASEQKVFSAARDICRAFEYAAKNNHVNAAWDDLHLNKILGKAAQSNNPAAAAQAIEKLLQDFLKFASPSNPELPKLPTNIQQ